MPNRPHRQQFDSVSILPLWKKPIASQSLNQGTNDISVNGMITTRVDIRTRTDPIEGVVFEASDPRSLKQRAQYLLRFEEFAGDLPSTA